MNTGELKLHTYIHNSENLNSLQEYRFVCNHKCFDILYS